MIIKKTSNYVKQQPLLFQNCKQNLKVRFGLKVSMLNFFADVIKNNDNFMTNLC